MALLGEKAAWGLGPRSSAAAVLSLLPECETGEEPTSAATDEGEGGTEYPPTSRLEIVIREIVSNCDTGIYCRVRIE